MKIKLPLFIIWLSVSAACSSPVSRNIQDVRPEPQAEAGSSDGIPYPVPTLQDRLDYLEGKIVRLSNEVETLNGKVKALEHAKTHPSGRTYVQKLDDRKLKEHYLDTEGGKVSAYAGPTAQSLYNQALKHYQNGRFSAAAALLKGADGAETAAASRNAVCTCYCKAGRVWVTANPSSKSGGVTPTVSKALLPHRKQYSKSANANTGCSRKTLQGRHGAD